MLMAATDVNMTEALSNGAICFDISAMAPNTRGKPTREAGSA